MREGGGAAAAILLSIYYVLVRPSSPHTGYLILVITLHLTFFTAKTENRRSHTASR